MKIVPLASPVRAPSLLTTGATLAVRLLALGAAGLLLSTAARAQAPPRSSEMPVDVATEGSQMNAQVCHAGDSLTTTIGVGTTSSSSSTTIAVTPTTLPPSVCADPGRNGITASDALILLRATVGLGVCEACICDVDGNGILGATDALIALRASTGIPVELNCPPCA